MGTQHVTFRCHTIRVTGTYKCSGHDCGKRFKRTAKDEWTENPFHPWHGREAELNDKAAEVCKKNLMAVECPGCGRGNQAPDKFERSHSVR